MRISVMLLIFLVLFNGWAGLLQQYDIDDHVGITAETGDTSELDKAQSDAREIQRGDEIGGTLLGYYNGLVNTVKNILGGIQPGLQMLVNIAPAGPAEDAVVWLFSIINIVIAADIIAIARGVDL